MRSTANTRLLRSFRGGFWLAGFLLAVLTNSASGWSLFNAEGLGRPIEGYDHAARAAGGTAIGVADPFGMSTVNPALIAWAEKPQFQVGFLSESVHASNDQEQETERLGGTRIPAIHLVVPAWKSSAVSFGFRDRTDSEYKISRTINAGEEDEFKQVIEGSGSLGEVFATIAIQAPDKTASAGFRIGVAGGTLREEFRSDFVHFPYIDSEHVLRTRLEPTYPMSFGLQLRPPKTVIGFVYEPGGTIHLKSLLGTSFGADLQDQSDLELPSKIGIGASFEINPRLRVSTDFSHNNWGKSPFLVTEGDPFPGSVFHSPVDTSRWGVGLVRLPNPDRTLLESAHKQMVWRVGFYTAHLPFPQRKQKVPEWAITGGFGVPVQFDRGYVDVLFEFGRRGDADEFKLVETYVRLGVSATFQKLRSRF